MRPVIALSVMAALTVGSGAAWAAYTPWGLVARGVLGRIQSLRKDQTPTAPGYDIATVVLAAPADRVFAKVRELAHRNPDIRVTDDPAQMRVDIEQGTKRGSLSVTSLGEHLSQIIVAEALAPGQTSDTPMIVLRILRICQELHQACSTAN
jgi:hypothetical protein